MIKLLKILLLSICFLFAILRNIFAIENRVDYHAPIGVMRDHIHDKNDFMLAYRYKNMSMRGLANNRKDISLQQAMENYMNAAINMSMKMHMISAMYGVTDKFTISLMGAYLEKDMKLKNKMSSSIKSRNIEGVSDVKLNGLYQFYNNNNKKAQFNFGLNIPIGKINNSKEGKMLAYGMQNGSGTIDFMPGISFSSLLNSFSYGAQLNSTIRTGRNYRGYRFGDNYNATLWLAKKLTNNISISTRIDANITDEINQSDQELANMSNMAPPMNNDLYDKKQIDSLIGVNYLITNGYLSGNRFAFEYGVPIYQRIDGPMLKNKYKITFGWQKSF
ncbi:hypothetical protein N9R48_02575 [Rickettsiales bacterium]|nr:hypothetical protein [Rickettsiales bacterium]